MKDTLYSDEINIPLSKLKLDPNNIRFRHMGTELTEQQIQQYLLEEEDVRLLIKEITNARQLYQPLLVIKLPDGTYVVKEGNRRCLSLRMIQEQIRNGKLKGFTEDHFNMVPCIILTGTEKQIDVLLGTIHVSGAKPWKSTNRGYLIYKCIEVHGDDPKQVADSFGMVKSKVIMAYKGFIATERYGQKYETDGGKYVKKFWVFEELYRNSTTKEWVQENEENLDYFINVVGKSKMSNLKDVRKFAKFLKLDEVRKSRILEVLNNDNMTEAWKLYEKEEKPEKAWNVVSSLHSALLEFSHEFLKEAIGNKLKQRILTDLASTVAGLQGDLSSLEKNRAEMK